MTFEFSGPIWFWKGPAPWYFITVPTEQSAKIKAASRFVTYGWGMIPVQAQIGNTAWTTSLFFKDEHYVIPIRANVRKAEGLEEGQDVAVQMTLG
ncbi:DUF1905 domain-containing protein [Deinococcus sp. Arct2-2]|uniref:DUF1905 domain-containing protein n=1 Tax=Deinococcus sp. Arct2-2 TaxID=2568653 RepID=UPI0010A3FF4E|nr:DUF1905 domain-containing protein [Deinococcus sp. Arct2-2]THF70602.1 DUF1905 domain-containing protein [Deinococcus sp. Arct2-2]